MQRQAMTHRAVVIPRNGHVSGRVVSTLHLCGPCAEPTPEQLHDDGRVDGVKSRRLWMAERERRRDLARLAVMFGGAPPQRNRQPVTTVKPIRKHAKNENREWTADADSQVIAMAVPDRVLADALGRSVQAIEVRRYKLRLVVRRAG